MTPSHHAAGLHPICVECGDVHGGLQPWRGHRVVVLTPTGKLRASEAARVGEAAAHAPPGVLVVDLLRADTSDTDAVAALLRALAGARRGGWEVLVANAAADVEIALRPVSIPVVDTTERSAADIPGQRPQ